MSDISYRYCYKTQQQQRMEWRSCYWYCFGCHGHHGGF